MASGGPHDRALRQSFGSSGDAQMVDGPQFRVDRIAGKPTREFLARYVGRVLIVPLAGTVTLGEFTIEAGECGWTENLAIADFGHSESCLVTQPTV